ncbi:MAG TPA: putative Na+/H+ antiporter, partial [Bdellovibrionales bacterium]|nr:putative Na+/H+ antiporter [Bdellovibrionales bacterium]
MKPSPVEALATIFFALAVIHTFISGHFRHMAAKFPEGSIGENFFHMIGEVEVVFGLWAALFLAVMAMTIGPTGAIGYAESLN